MQKKRPVSICFTKKEQTMISRKTVNRYILNEEEVKMGILFKYLRAYVVDELERRVEIQG